MAKTLFELTEGSAPLLSDYALNGEDPANTHVLRRITLQSLRNLFMGAPTATGDFPVGNSSGVWQKKTLAETQALLGVDVLQTSVNGWIPATGTWTYASATTITVPSGAAAIYSVGDKIKLTQTTVKYFYVVAVANTVLTVTGGSDYTVANEAITLPYYSKAASPLGFPTWFNWLPTLSWTAGTTPTNPVTASNQFAVIGKLACFNVYNSFSTAGETVTAVTLTLPIAPSGTQGANGTVTAGNAPVGTAAFITAASGIQIYCTSCSATRIIATGEYSI